MDDFEKNILMNVSTTINLLLARNSKAASEQSANYGQPVAEEFLQLKEFPPHEEAFIPNEKELKKMPKFVKTLFIRRGLKARIRQKEYGVYEIRCNIHNVHYSASSKNLEEAKRKFLEKLSAIKDTSTQKPQQGITFEAYYKKWLEIKKEKIKQTSYDDLTMNFRNKILPVFGKRKLSSITKSEIELHLQTLGNTRTAVKTYIYLKGFFDYAFDDQVIKFNPASNISKPVHEAEKGVALTYSEEKELINYCLKSPTTPNMAAIFLLYTGLRRGELKNARIEGDFVWTTTGKARKGTKEKERCIPISPELKKYLPLIDLNEITKLTNDKISRLLKTIFNGKHHTHELRHTFISRCQELGINHQLVSVWVGHSLGGTQTVATYTHFSPEFMLQEIQKFSYKIF